MKIHIVQKGDSLWKIAQKYGVDFNELKQVNNQLSNPDLIMPGMKIKIPTGSVPVKKKEIPKEMPQPMQHTPTPAKEMPTSQEGKKEAPIPQMPHMPQMPQTPIDQSEIDYNIEQKMYNYTFNIPTFPKPPYMKKQETLPKKEKEQPTPEMQEQVSEVEQEMTEEVESPTTPAQPMPSPTPPMSYSPYCVPMTGWLPGSGLPCPWYPIPVLYQPYPPLLPLPYSAPFTAAPMAVSPTGYEGIYGTSYQMPEQATSPEMMEDDEMEDVSTSSYPGLSTNQAMYANTNSCDSWNPPFTPQVAPGYGMQPMWYGPMPMYSSPYTVDAGAMYPYPMSDGWMPTSQGACHHAYRVPESSASQIENPYREEERENEEKKQDWSS